MKHTRILLTLLVVLATVAVPTAGAALDEGNGSSSPSVVLRRSAPPGYQGRVYTTEAPSAAIVKGAPRSFPGVNAPSGPSRSTAATSIDVDWADAGIGAGVVLGAAMLLGGLVLVTRRTGRVATH
jgi:hypothetical protein